MDWRVRRVGVGVTKDDRVYSPRKYHNEVTMRNIILKGQKIPPLPAVPAGDNPTLDTCGLASLFTPDGLIVLLVVDPPEVPTPTPLSLSLSLSARSETATATGPPE
jgi:hypothetical protein